MRVLITNLHFGYNSGSEVVIELLADGLRRAGHAPMLLAPDLGGQAYAARERGHIIVDRVAALPSRPDVIHAQHTTVALAAFAAFPDAPAVFSCHSGVFEVEAPRPHPQIRRWIAVDDFCRDKCLSRGVPNERLTVILNAVDLERFSRRAPLPRRPSRALLLTKNTGHHEAVREACAASGIELNALGPSTGKVSTELERELRGYDLVFATARMALEAASVGCAVVVCDGRGFAGMLTSANLPHWRRMNLGAGLLVQPTTTEAVLNAIEQYDAQDAGVVTDLVRTGASLEDFVARHVEVYSRAIADPAPDPAACKAATVTWIEDLAPTPTDRSWKAVAREALSFQAEPMVNLVGDVEQRVQQQLHRHAEQIDQHSADRAVQTEDRLARHIDAYFAEWGRASEASAQRFAAQLDQISLQIGGRLDQTAQRLDHRLDIMEGRLAALAAPRPQKSPWERLRGVWRERVPHSIRKPLFDLRQRLLRRRPVL